MLSNNAYDDIGRCIIDSLVSLPLRYIMGDISKSTSDLFRSRRGKVYVASEANLYVLSTLADGTKREGFNNVMLVRAIRDKPTE